MLDNASASVSLVPNTSLKRCLAELVEASVNYTIHCCLSSFDRLRMTNNTKLNIALAPVTTYRTNPTATPPSTFNTFPVDLFRFPPTKAKQALAISSGKIISLSNVRFA